MGLVSGAIRYLFSNFGPIIVFALANRFFGLKTAILISLAFTVGEIVHRKAIRREKLGAFFVFSAFITLLFGAIDLYLKDSFLYRYEAAITNVVFGVYFGRTVFGERPLVLELAETSGRLKHAVTPEITRYFRGITLVWASYFVLKAGFYLWVATQGYSVERQLAIRGVVGNTSLYLLMAVSTLGGRKLFVLARKLGWLQTASAPDVSASGQLSIS